MMIDQRSFAELRPKPNWTWQDRMHDLSQYEQCVMDLNRAGRYCIDEVVKGWGYARVVQALAIVIVKNPHDFDLDVVALAQQIPLPVRQVSRHLNWHRAFVQTEFMRLVKLHLVDVAQ